MPCQDTWLESERDARDARSKREERVKKLSQYVADSLQIDIQTISSNHQARTKFLCKSIKGLSRLGLDTIVYNGRSKQARDLADWWDEHQEMDKKREEEERRVQNEKRLKQSALSKLTKAERKALGV